MKKTTIILSALMVMLCSSGVAYAEAGEGKPLEVEKTEVSIQKQNNNEKAYNFTGKIDNEKNNIINYNNINPIFAYSLFEYEHDFNGE